MNSDKYCDRGLKKVPDDLMEPIYTLKLYGNEIEKIENIPNSVQALYMDSNNLSKIENLPDTLTQLYVGNNKIERIEWLPKSLHTLGIHGNPIKEVIINNKPKNLTSIVIGKAVEYIDPKLYNCRITSILNRKYDNEEETKKSLRVSYYFTLGYATIKIQRWWRKALSKRSKRVEESIYDGKIGISINI
jgi:uncharacterized protein YlzI (FlbEa/FlbD family)